MTPEEKTKEEIIEIEVNKVFDKNYNIDRRDVSIFRNALKELAEVIYQKALTEGIKLGEEKMLEKVEKEIDDLIGKGHKCPDCKREEDKCIEAFSVLELKQRLKKLKEQGK